MTQNAFFRRFAPLLLFLLLCGSMVLPALALFDQWDTGLGDDEAPIAVNLRLSTYKNVAITGSLSGIDPEGDPLTFRVTRHPARGALTFSQEGDAAFTYTPYENKTGRDLFSYVAEDSAGHVSEAADVDIRILKPATKVRYGDLEGHPAHKAALTLAERGIFVGEQMGAVWFFRPDAPLTRQEFLSLSMDTMGMDPGPDSAIPTGFADDSQIASWARPYVVSALRTGMIQGDLTDPGRAVFAPDAVITQAEAAVLLNRLLRVSDTDSSASPASAAVPAWANQAVVNLASIGLLDPNTAGLGEGLTRGQAAELLSAALDVLDHRSGIW